MYVNWKLCRFLISQFIKHKTRIEAKYLHFSLKKNLDFINLFARKTSKEKKYINVTQIWGINKNIILRIRELKRVFEWKVKDL